MCFTLDKYHAFQNSFVNFQAIASDLERRMKGSKDELESEEVTYWYNRFTEVVAKESPFYSFLLTFIFTTIKTTEQDENFRKFPLVKAHAYLGLTESAQTPLRCKISTASTSGDIADFITSNIIKIFSTSTEGNVSRFIKYAFILKDRADQNRIYEGVICCNNYLEKHVAFFRHCGSDDYYYVDNSNQKKGLTGTNRFQALDDVLKFAAEINEFAINLKKILRSTLPDLGLECAERPRSFIETLICDYVMGEIPQKAAIISH